ncbi:hypothetical protein [Bradyrhizobium vignae]|uniref:hypothetical protein n=1 Tax=Bradyrhizobium vignae TaxID=1549949 RepID=UPI000F008664|nr:hypothetical protein [Bradyrhizobium vignae]
MNSAKYTPRAESKEREDFIKLIPAPDEVFIAAAKRAVIISGLSKETIEALHPEKEPERSLR